MRREVFNDTADSGISPAEASGTPHAGESRNNSYVLSDRSSSEDEDESLEPARIPGQSTSKDREFHGSLSGSVVESRNGGVILPQEPSTPTVSGGRIAAMPGTRSRTLPRIPVVSRRRPSTSDLLMLGTGDDSPVSRYPRRTRNPVNRFTPTDWRTYKLMDYFKPFSFLARSH